MIIIERPGLGDICAKLKAISHHQAAILITQLTSSDKFCQINEWSKSSLDRYLGLLEDVCDRFFCKDSSKEEIANRKPPSLPPEMRQINCHSRAGGLKSCFCQNTS